MTANQIKFREAKEVARSNQVREAETNRANVAKERETRRSNKAKEHETSRSNKERERQARAEHAYNMYDKDERRKLDKKQFIADTAFKGIGLVGKAFNDPAWTNQDPQATKDVANVYFSVPLGSKQWDPVTDTRAVPGIARINFMPGIGVQKYYSDFGSVNAAFRLLFAHTRKQNSGSVNYDSNDEGMYILAMDSPLMFISMCIRAYGLIGFSNTVNRYMGLHIARSMGFSDEVLNDPARFRAFINRCITQLKVFNIPKVLPLFERHSWLCSAVFKDADKDQAQYWYYMPEALYLYRATGGVEGSGMLEPYILQQGFSFSSLQNYWDALWEPLINDEDIAIISGDIAKAYSDLYVLSEIPEGFKIEPVYNEDALQQLHATTFMGSPIFPGNCIYQDPSNGAIIWGYPKMAEGYLIREGDIDFAAYDKLSDWLTGSMDMFFKKPWVGLPVDYIPKSSLRYNRLGYASGASVSSARENLDKFCAVDRSRVLLNMYSDRRDPEWIMEYTRNISMYAQTGAIVLIDPIFNLTAGSEYTEKVVGLIGICGSEYFTTAQIYYNDGSIQGDFSLQYVHIPGTTWVTSVISSTSAGGIGTMIYKSLSTVAAYDWFPTLYPLLYYTMEEGGTIPVEQTTDIQTYTYITSDMLNNMTYVAMLSYLGVPNLGNSW